MEEKGRKKNEGKSLKTGGKMEGRLKHVECTVWSDIQSVTQHGVRRVQCQV